MSGRSRSVIHPDDRKLFEAASQGFELPEPVFGGATRQASVLAGLEALAAAGPESRADPRCGPPFRFAGAAGARPRAARANGAAIPALPVTDTVKQVDDSGRVLRTIDRTDAALRADAADLPLPAACSTRIGARARKASSTSPTMPRWPNGPGLPVSTFEGEATNIKLTTPDDFLRAEAMLIEKLSDIRTGMGFDVHAFGDGDHVMLGGVRIAHDRGLSGHSDADVVLHALVDAILGALADGDIGAHFPPSDPTMARRHLRPFPELRRRPARRRAAA